MFKRHSVVIAMTSAIGILGALTPLEAAPYLRPGVTEGISTSIVPVDDRFKGGHVAPLSSVDTSGRYVAFQHAAADLVRGDINEASDIFLRDRQKNELRLISNSPIGLPALGVCASPADANQSNSSDRPSISGNGRFISFDSCAANLVAGDTNSQRDVFVFDRRANMIERISTTTTGQQVDSRSTTTVNGISANGRFVAFVSTHVEVGGTQSTGSGHIYVHDRRTGTVEMVSTAPDGTPADGTSSHPAISANGRYVAFESSAANLIEDDGNNQADVFLHDRKSGRTKRISVATDGSEARPLGGFGNFIHLSLSGDGRHVAFLSIAQNLVPNDSDVPAQIGSVDVFVHDVKTARTERVSTAWTGAEVTHPSLPGPWKQHSGGFGMGISDDGRYVVFDSQNHGFVADEEFSYLNLDGLNPLGTAYIYDRHTGAVDAISRSLEGKLSQGAPTSVSTSGRHVTFWSWDAPALVRGTNELSRRDVFMRSRGSALGVEFNEEPQGHTEQGEEPICVNSDICIPPSAAMSAADAVDDLNPVLTELGANLYGASLAYRPQYEDLFAAIELEHMPKVTPGASPIFYGLRFEVKGRSYEVRATPVNLGTFGLFDCTDSVTCTKIADLRGGFGTTGMRVVFSLPLDRIGLENGGKLFDAEAFSALGSFHGRTIRVLDTVGLR